MRKVKIIQIAFAPNSPNPFYLLSDGRVLGWGSIENGKDTDGITQYAYVLSDITPKISTAHRFFPSSPLKKNK